MAGNPNQKLKLLYMADLLKRDSDEEHCLSISDIIEQLERKGITAERKSIYRDIDVLKEYGLPIEHGTVPQRGYYLTETDFQFSELMLLTDAVLASPIISQKKTTALVDKLQNLTNIHASKRLLARVSVDGRAKSANEELYYNIDQINLAINSGRKIRFIYQKINLVGNLPVYGSGREFIISPYATVWHEDKYYIVGNYDKYDDLSHYRIDRMRHVECLFDEQARSFREVSSYTTHFDAADYAKTVFNMFAGSNQRTIELICENRLLEHIIERFGINLPYRRIGEEHFCVKAHVVVNEGLVKWILGYGGDIVVRSPEELRDTMRDRLADMLGKYE